jgi:hypothetical protein
VLAAGYILLREENKRLRKTAVTAILLGIFLAIAAHLIILSFNWWLSNALSKPQPDFIFNATTADLQTTVRNIQYAVQYAIAVIPIVCGVFAFFKP